ncbi:MAG: L-histidine N(alpha)-methyltransferase, partial [Burkholderiales bacterium]|nr:L-histidine N(alpha)-methyltransferase [Burkholderiales bacterium]
MDAFGLRPVSALRRRAGRGGRVQRQVHGRPARAARLQLRDAARPCARELPQLLPSGGALAVQRAAARARPVSEFARELRAALAARPRSIAPKWFYDAAGSRLFDRICELPEYYPTRVELALLERHASAIAGCIGAGAEIVEFGAGSARKLRALLGALEAPLRYLPIDISGEHLLQAAAALRADHPALEVQPVVGDYVAGVELPQPRGRRVGFFPGSSIGNFDPVQAQALLLRMAALTRGAGLLIGVDRVKDPALLHAAYNDAAGVTAAFNLNLWARANAEAGADFDLDAWYHSAFYNAPLRRIEMHLVSRCAQVVTVAGQRFEFAEGESVHTENSYKYADAAFGELARAAGFEPRASWTDERRLFTLHWLASP